MHLKNFPSATWRILCVAVIAILMMRPSCARAALPVYQVAVRKADIATERPIRLYWGVYYPDSSVRFTYFADAGIDFARADINAMLVAIRTNTDLPRRSMLLQWHSAVGCDVTYLWGPGIGICP